MHILEKHFGLDFFEQMEKMIGCLTSKTSDTHFTIHLKSKKEFDFSIIEKENLLVIGFPFTVKKKYVTKQYQQFVYFGDKTFNSTGWIEIIKRRIDGYNQGQYKNLEGI